MLNEAILIGFVGQDVEMRETKDGDGVANLSLATTEKWKGKDGSDHKETEWHKLVVFGPLAGVFKKFISKGSKIWVRGKIQTQKWEDKSGNSRETKQIIVNKLIMLSEQAKDAPANDYPDYDDSDLPF